MENKLLEFLHQKQLTDISLTFIDDNNNELTFDAHKLILCASCVYFEKLLLENFKEKNLDKIKMVVPDIHICYDIVMSFYGQIINSGDYPDWYRIIHTNICRDFFGLNNDLSSLIDLNIPLENFDELLKVVNIIGYNETTLTCLIKNCPCDYDLSVHNIPKKLIKKMIKNPTTYIVYGDHNIHFYDFDKNHTIRIINAHNDKIYGILFSMDSQQIISGSRDYTIKIWDPKTGDLIKKLDKHESGVTGICHSFDKKYIISG